MRSRCFWCWTRYHTLIWAQLLYISLFIINWIWRGTHNNPLNHSWCCTWSNCNLLFVNYLHTALVCYRLYNTPIVALLSHLTVYIFYFIHHFFIYWWLNWDLWLINIRFEWTMEIRITCKENLMLSRGSSIVYWINTIKVVWRP